MSDMTHGHHDHDHDLEAKKALRPEIERDSNYWLSLEHYAKDPEFMKLAETEFQSSPLREGDQEDGVARRDFLKLMGASLALASAGCVRRPVQKIVPYNKQPEEIVIGVPNYYSSSFFDGNETLGLLVKTREGRPIKVEGNPEHPLNKGAVSIKAQASILNLYDPERLKGPKKNLFNEKRTNKDTIDANWDNMDQEIADQLKKGGAAILTGNLSGPASRAVVSDFCQAFKAQHYQFEALSNEEIREGQKASYGDDSVPNYRFDKARMIISIDADFLGTWLTPMAFTKQFSAARKNIEKMPRLVSFDSHYSLTGANADIRVRIKPSQQMDVALALLAHLPAGAVGSAGKDLVERGRVAAGRLGAEPELLKKIAADLWENRGQSLVVAGGPVTQTATARDLQIVVNYLNDVLGNEGKTVEGRGANPGLKGSWKEVASLIKDMKDGKVKTLILHGANPLYSLPEAAGFLEALRKVEMVVSTADRLDETSSHAHYIIPDNHALETWGDAEALSGLYSIQQPTIRPMYDTRSFQLSLMTWAFVAKVGPKRLQELETYYDYLRAVWRDEVYPKAGKGQGFEAFWSQALQTGFVGEGPKVSSRSFRSDSLSLVKSSPTQEGVELVLYPNVMMGDGTKTNVAWLHELPDPMTKICWDNYASVSLAFAKKNALLEGDLVKIDVGHGQVEIPVHIQPGLHDEVMAIALGYGRTAGGKVTNGVGRAVTHLIKWDDSGPQFSGHVLKFTKTGKSEQLANVQAHTSMEGRQIVVEATLAEYEKNKSANIHRHHIWSLWSGHQYNGHKWGMAIDLNSCTGCNACVVSCQSENNIPVVGKKYVLQGREMGWIRIDRYHVGSPESAETVFQPVMCQHCDNAPCETVCPVLATVHTDDGLNAMAYNRCVGTRYCANNCPYKVRRFNWFNYTGNIEKPLHMALNPEVTVRPRGVMEKCSFCVQRIKEAKNTARLEKRPLRDGEVKTACQTSCPADAITFGDMNDPNSEVSKKFANDRAYTLLEEWHAAPAVRYMSKIRNNGQDKRHGGKAHGQGEHA